MVGIRRPLFFLSVLKDSSEGGQCLSAARRFINRGIRCDRRLHRSGTGTALDTLHIMDCVGYLENVNPVIKMDGIGSARPPGLDGLDI